MTLAAPELARRIADALEAAYARASLVEIVGEEDDRIARWDRLVSDAQRR